ncbi:MAG: B12-binding domain-containing radical SAM protein [Promethearchaeota archaeon]
MKILIVDALSSGQGSRRFTRDVISAGPRTIAGILKKFAIESKIITVEQFLKKNQTIIADHLFISAMSMDFPAVKRIIRKWNTLPQIDRTKSLKILGGPITSAQFKIFLNLDIDIGVIGEAEKVLSELILLNIFQNTLNLKSLESIPGIIFQSSQKIIENPRPSFLSKEELNSFYPSTKHIQDYPFYRTARIFVECVRGCSNFFRTKIRLPGGRVCNNCGTCSTGNLAKRLRCPLSIPPGCGYCSIPHLYGPPRSRSLIHIITEIKELMELGVIRFILGASDFLDYQRDELVTPKPLTDPRNPPPNYFEIEKLLSKIADLIAGRDIYIFIENIKASLFTEKLAVLIASYLPQTNLSIGCETGSNIHSKLLGRSSSPQEVFKAVKFAKKHNLRVHTYFIHGLPGQTLQTAIETKRFMKKLASEGIEKITVYKFKPLPMSAFEDVLMPPPASHNKASKIIVDTAIQINREKKENYIGRIERAIVSELARGDNTKVIGYPLYGGPTILIDDAADSLGKIVQVKITKILSDKLIGGYIISK